MGIETRNKSMVQNVWTLALFPGLMKTRLNFSRVSSDRLEMLETWGQLSILTQINLIAKPQLLIHGFPEMIFL